MDLEPSHSGRFKEVFVEGIFYFGPYLRTFWDFFFWGCFLSKSKYLLSLGRFFSFGAVTDYFATVVHWYHQQTLLPFEACSCNRKFQTNALGTKFVVTLAG